MMLLLLLISVVKQNQLLTLILCYLVQHQWHPEREREREREREIKERDCNKLQSLEHLFQMKAQNQKTSQGLHKPLQLL